MWSICGTFYAYINLITNYSIQKLKMNLFFRFCNRTLYGCAFFKTQDRPAPAPYTQSRGMRKIQQHKEVKMSKLKERSGKIPGLTAAFAVIFVLLSIPAAASDFGFSANVDAVTKYFWRGQLLYDKPALQPGFEMTFDNLSAGFWGSYHPEAGEFAEADYTISYSETVPGIDSLSMGAGFTVYTFPYVPPPAGNNSTEIFIGVSGDVLASPSLTFFYDPVAGKGGYLDMSIGQDFDIERFTISAGLNIGYNFAQWGYKKSFSAALVRLGTAYAIGSASLSLGVNSQIALDEQYENGFFGSLGISYEM